jgi:acetyl esterase/lipase
MRRIFCLLLLSLLAPSAASSADESPGKAKAKEGAAEWMAPKVPAGIELCADLTYRTVGKIQLQLDLACPKNGKGPFPVVVIFHGAGIKEPHRKKCLPFAFEFARGGYVAVVVSYRYRPEEARFPGPVEDAQAAVRWLRSNAHKYRIDAERIGALGFSVGGSLSCLLGMLDDPENAKQGKAQGRGPKERVASSRVCAVVSLAGPSDLKCWHEEVPWLEGLVVRGRLDKWLGGPPEKAGKLYAEASPITHVCKSAAPMLLIHGSKDSVVPVKQSEILAKALWKNGVVAGLLTVECAHDDFDDLDHPATPMAWAVAHAFMRQYLQPAR